MVAAVPRLLTALSGLRQPCIDGLEERMTRYNALLEPVGSSPVALSAPELRSMRALPVQAPVEIA